MGMRECKHKITNVPSGFHFGTGAKFSYCAGPCPGKPVVHGTQNSTLSKPCQGTQNICIGVRKSECKHKITNVPSGFHFGTGAKFSYCAGPCPGKSFVTHSLSLLDLVQTLPHVAYIYTTLLEQCPSVAGHGTLLHMLLTQGTCPHTHHVARTSSKAC